MHADLVAALKAGWPRVHFVTVTLADTTIRWTDAGSVVWSGNTYAARNATYGTLDSISEITDGVDDDASPVTLTIIPPDLASVADITAADAQGGRVTIHLGAVNPTTRVLVSEPYRLFIGELDQPKLKQGRRRLLEYEVITGEARGLEPNEEQRQTDAFHQMIWPGELGNQFATDGPKVSYWRADEPRRSIGVIPGRGNDDNKARQFTYEPEAPFVFPFGSRIGVAGKIRYQQGYGATNRYYDIYATLGASGPVDGLISVTIDDVVTTFDGFGKATNGEHAGEMWFQFLPGAQPSLALASPTGTNANSTPAPGWTSAHKLSGRPCFVWTGKENSKEDEFRGGVPRIIVTIAGLLGWDPRLDSTQTEIGGSGSCRLDDPLTWVLLTEGCIVGLNWAIGRWEGSNGAGSPAYGVPYQCVPVGGIAAPLDTIDVAAFVAAAEIADGYGWVMAGAPMSDEDKSDVLADMLAASGARLARRGGMISCVSLAAAKASVTTVTAADTVGPVEISLAPSRLDRRNIGIPSYLSEDNHWEQTTLAPVGDPAWKAADGGRRSKAFDYPYAPAADQASQLCYLDLSHDREGISAEWTFKPYMLQVEAGECFDIDEPAFLLEGVKALALRRSYDPSSGLVKVRFREETDIKYEDMLDQVGTGPPPTDPDAPPAEVIALLGFPDGPFENGVASANAITGLEGWTYARSGSAMAANADGSVDTFAPDVERITDQGLRIEAPATNRFLRSQEFDNASWSKINLEPVAANAAVAPDGTTTADTIIASVAGGASVQHRVDQTPVTTAGAQTISVYAKPAGYDYITLRIGTAGSGFAYNVATGTIFGSEAGVTASIVPAAYGYYRCILTVASAAANAIGRINTSPTTTISFVGDGVSGAHLWQADLVDGSSPTVSSPILTTSAVVTRPADTATLVLPAGSSSDPITIVHSGGTVNTTRGALADPLLLNLGGASGGAWVGNYIESVTVEAA